MTSVQARNAVDAAPAMPGTRIVLLDAARGVALVAMAIFHAAWDMAFLGLADIDPANDPGWKWFARLIAASFLAIAGASLVLATRQRLDWPVQIRRIAKIAAAAALVTLATWIALPQNYVWFGILHHIAIASLIALPLARAPLILSALLAWRPSPCPASSATRCSMRRGCTGSASIATCCPRSTTFPCCHGWAACWRASSRCALRWHGRQTGWDGRRAGASGWS